MLIVVIVVVAAFDGAASLFLSPEVDILLGDDDTFFILLTLQFPLAVTLWESDLSLERSYGDFIHLYNEFLF